MKQNLSHEIPGETNGQRNWWLWHLTVFFFCLLVAGDAAKVSRATRTTRTKTPLLQGGEWVAASIQHGNPEGQRSPSATRLLAQRREPGSSMRFLITRCFEGSYLVHTTHFHSTHSSNWFRYPGFATPQSYKMENNSNVLAPRHRRQAVHGRYLRLANGSRGLFLFNPRTSPSHGHQAEPKECADKPDFSGFSWSPRQTPGHPYDIPPISPRAAAEFQ